MKCPNCGAELSNGAQECVHCSSKLIRKMGKIIL